MNKRLSYLTTDGRVYTCSHCGRQGHWSESWAWHGSYKNLEDGRWDKILFACSDACKGALSHSGTEEPKP